MSRADSPLRDRMVFVVGAQRSGTNWLQRMLAVHPDVTALPGETHLFTHGIDVLAERVQHGLLSSPSTGTIFMDRDDFLDAARDFCDRAFTGVAERLGGRALRVVERSPNHVARLPLITDVYPDAWVVHIVRDGRDVARSVVSQPWGPVSVAAAARQWAETVGSAHALGPSLPRYLEVGYERLLDDPAAGVRSVLDWLGLPVTGPVLEQVVAEAGVGYNVDARRPDVGVGKWRTEWSPADLADFERAAGAVNATLGYPTVDVARVPVTSRLRSSLRAASRAGAGGRAWLRGRWRAGTTVAERLPLETRQRRLDELCAAAAAGDGARAAAGLAPDAPVRVVTPAGDRRAVGERGRALLEQEIDGRPWGCQRRGDVHVAGDALVAVLTHGEAGERGVHRVVVARFGADAGIVGLTYQRLDP